jgi:hypothetical protein
LGALGGNRKIERADRSLAEHNLPLAEGGERGPGWFFYTLSLPFTKKHFLQAIESGMFAATLLDHIEII